jgi:hypothetical protein
VQLEPELPDLLAVAAHGLPESHGDRARVRIQKQLRNKEVSEVMYLKSGGLDGQ